LRPEQLLDRRTLARFDALRRWRAQTAEGRGVAPDIVLTNEVLLEIIKRLPRTQAELLEIEGIGPWKARNYGPDLLRILNR
jgi:ATP-dependent DNA helicase RecQ